MKGSYSEIIAKLRRCDVILRHVTSFSYILLYNDVIRKNAYVSENMTCDPIFFSEIELSLDHPLSCQRLGAGHYSFYS